MPQPKARRRKPTKLNETQELEKALEILRLRREGKSFRAIGKAVGLDHKLAWKIHQKYLEQVRQVTEQQAEDIRDLELIRLDRALETVTTILESQYQEPDVRLRAVDRLVKISERRTKLRGVDAPEKVEVSGPDGAAIALEVDRMSPDELDRELAAFFAGVETEPSKNGKKAKT